jgi:predicted amidohydrolase
MSDSNKIAAVQLKTSGDLEKDLGRAAERVVIAKQTGASLVVFGELFGWRWFADQMDKGNFDQAQTLDGPAMKRWAQIAGDNKTAIAAPIFLHDGQGGYSNAVVVIDKQGRVKSVSRSVHIPQIPGWEGKFYFQPGQEYTVAKIDGMPVGFLICWDAFFPEAFRALALRGVRVVVVPTSATGANEDLWQRALAAQAFFNGFYVVRANRVGEEKGLTFCGQSFCATPTGDLLGDPMGAVEGMAVYDIERKVVELTRREFPFLKDRMPQTYLDLANLAIQPKKD